MNNNEQQKTEGREMGDGAQQEGLVEQAKHVATAVAGKVGETVSHEIEEKRDLAIKKMGGAAEAIRWGGGMLKNVGPLGEISEKAADGIEGVASFFENKEIGDVVRDVERFARREPAIFFGAAFAIGLIGGRFLKSSGHRNMDGDRMLGGDDGDEAMYAGNFRDRGEDDYMPDTRRNLGRARVEGPQRSNGPDTARLGTNTAGRTPITAATRTSTTGRTGGGGAIKPQPIVNAAPTTGSATAAKTGSTTVPSTTEKPRNGIGS